VADVKCGLCEINKNNRANATHAPSLIQEMFPDRTEAMLEQRGPGPGPGTGPVLSGKERQSLVVDLIDHYSCYVMKKINSTHQC